MKRTEDSLRDLWDNNKHTNILIIGVPEEEQKKKGYEKIFEEIIVDNFPNMEKEIVNQKTKIMASGPITSWQVDGETMETVRDFIFLGSKITADGDCSHEIKMGKMQESINKDLEELKNKHTKTTQLLKLKIL